MISTENYRQLLEELKPGKTTLVAVSKTKPAEDIAELYDLGQRIFGENYVQELTEKRERLPEDIQWHFIGHLQSNKVKYIAPFISVIQSVDSLKLLKEIDKEARKNNRTIDCYLQLCIASEETKSGLSMEEADELFLQLKSLDLSHVSIKGLMGMASFSDDESLVKGEFATLRSYFEKVISQVSLPNVKMETLCMGMTSDYKTAIKEGSNMVRIGSAIFGERN